MKKKANKRSQNLISDLTEGKVKKVDFGGDIEEIGFSVKKWNECYGINRPESMKKIRD